MNTSLYEKIINDTKLFPRWTLLWYIYILNHQYKNDICNLYLNINPKDLFTRDLTSQEIESIYSVAYCIKNI